MNRPMSKEALRIWNLVRDVDTATMEDASILFNIKSIVSKEVSVRTRGPTTVSELREVFYLDNQDNKKRFWEMSRVNMETETTVAYGVFLNLSTALDFAGWDGTESDVLEKLALTVAP
jgi:hypothetical protein